VELGNFIEGWDLPGGSGLEAARALLQEIPGVSADWWKEVRTASSDRAGSAVGEVSWGALVPGGSTRAAYAAEAGSGPAPRADEQDWGRRYLPANGGCCYIDLDHLEICLPEVLSAYDHVAAWHAMLRIVREAMAAAETRLPGTQRLHVLANNSDGAGNSYGSHLDFLISRRLWDDIFRRKLQYLLFLASFQVSSIVYAGQGKVGSENGAPPADFQLSQRADFFEQLSAIQTTFARPIVNARDEPLCGGRPARDWDGRSFDPAVDLARLHVIFYDSNLCETAALLKVGVLQVILAMMEAGRVSLDAILDSPLQALRAWSHDPTLRARAACLDGRRVTAVELQLRFHEEACRFLAAGGADGIVPRAAEIVDLWGDTLEKLRARRWDALSGRLDWVLKRKLLQQAAARRGDLTWAVAKHLDHLYASLDESEGLHWACRARGAVDRVVSDEAIELLRHAPPENTRAWTRAWLLRHAGSAVERIDWDELRFWVDDGGPFRQRTLRMANPLDFTRASAGLDGAEEWSLDHILDRLGAAPGA